MIRIVDVQALTFLYTYPYVSLSILSKCEIKCAANTKLSLDMDGLSTWRWGTCSKSNITISHVTDGQLTLNP